MGRVRWPVLHRWFVKYLDILHNHSILLEVFQEDVEMVVGRLIMSTRFWDYLPSENELLSWDPTLVGERNEAFFTRVWKPLPNRRVLKTLRENPKRTMSASRGLELLQLQTSKWHQPVRVFFEILSLTCRFSHLEWPYNYLRNSVVYL